MFDVVGDRRDEDIAEVCGLVAQVFDRAILYEAEDLRGRSPGELMDLQERYLAAAGFAAAAVERVGAEDDAICRAVATAEPGELVCYMTGRVQDGIRLLTELAEGDGACGSGPASGQAGADTDAADVAEEAGEGGA